MCETKICKNPNCKHNGEPQPLNNFHKRNSEKDGLNRYCKECIKIERKNKYQRCKQNELQYYQKNKEQILEKQQKKYLENIDHVKQIKNKHRHSFSKFKTFFNNLSKYNECRLDPTNSDLLQVKCTYCNNWFNPLFKDVKSRLEKINTFNHGESNLYCSHGCKLACPTFQQRKFFKNKKPGTSREVPASLRKLVLERDNWTCMKCNQNRTNDPNIELHCHHIDPVINNPIESADLDNCITVCKECHKLLHQVRGCTFNELQCNN